MYKYVYIKIHIRSQFSMQLQIDLLGTYHLYIKMHLWSQEKKAGLIICHSISTI